MALTIRELAQIPTLRTRVIAGPADGRRVKWAHVCELPNPAEWLGEGDLVMSTGLGLPRGRAQQRAYVERLAAGGVSGLAIGESGTTPGAAMHGPPLTADFFAAADGAGFPVLMTAYEVPFVAVAHAVIQA